MTPGKPKPFDLLAELAKYGLEHQLDLNDPDTRTSFADHVVDAVERALADPVLMHGQRTEAMFEALVVSLGDFALLKTEDAGRVHPADRYRVPDFRVVLESGEQWLIEVKNVFIDDPADQRRKLMNRDYRDKLEAYAATTGATLKLAVYWAKWSVWTLVTPSRFVDRRGDVVIDMISAMRGDELGALGDRTIGTRPPLVLRLTMDPEKTSPLDKNGETRAVIQGTSIYAGGTEITDAIEKQIAWIFMQHGEWAEGESTPIVEGGRLIAMEFSWAPAEQRNIGFEIVGRLSRMYSRQFASETLRDGEIVQLRAAHRPGWFEPLVRRDHVYRDLPLWRFEIHPRYADEDTQGL